MKLSVIPTINGPVIIKAEVTLLEFGADGNWRINIALVDSAKRNVFKTVIGEVLSGTFYGDISESDLKLEVVSVDGLEVCFKTTTDPLTIKINKKSFEKN